MKISAFWIVAAIVLVMGALAPGVLQNNYYFFAGFAVLQALIMATAWNILGGFTGYVNFGSAGFFAVGVYTSVALFRLFEPPLIVNIVAAATISGLLGLATGYLTLRLRGVYFAIATLALAIVLETVAANWEFVGGARGAVIIPTGEVPFFSNDIEYYFFVTLVMAVIAVAVARYINNSKLGRGLAAIRDDETAAECMGVPTLRLKLTSTAVMGALMGMAGAPYPFVVSYVDPLSAFSLLVAVNAIAMPMIGGTSHWIGPVVGALLLGTAQQWITVNISSELNLLLVGGLLVGFVTLAPYGLVGLAQRLAGMRPRRSPRHAPA
ncbi:MAG TPA: branched-chain amino acid ABC transporter permease [Afifellaceae bacterium]|nr:branched-chain amino acid ABC transporter permease [Afifellaceae bacterium]